jgi:hypothetical protein
MLGARRERSKATVIPGLLAVAILGAVVIALFHTRLAAELRQSNLTGQKQQILVQADKFGGIIIPDTFSAEAEQEALRAIWSAFIYGFHRVMVACATLAFGGALVSLALIRGKTNKISGGDR